MKSVHDNSRFKVYRGNGKETFECQICQKDFSKTAKGLNSAMKFSTFNGLKNHFLILHNDSNFQACVCHVCYGSFRAHKLLRAHLRNVHNLNYGNISVPQNQEENDEIVDSSKINGHNEIQSGAMAIILGIVSFDSGIATSGVVVVVGSDGLPVTSSTSSIGSLSTRFCITVVGRCCSCCCCCVFFFSRVQQLCTRRKLLCPFPHTSQYPTIEL